MRGHFVMAGRFGDYCDSRVDLCKITTSINMCLLVHNACVQFSMCVNLTPNHRLHLPRHQVHLPPWRLQSSLHQ